MSNLAHDNVITAYTLQYTCIVGKGAAKVARKRKAEIDYDIVKIIHTMADGTVRDSVAGYEIPFNDTTAVAYNLLVKWTVEKKKQNTV